MPETVASVWTAEQQRMLRAMGLQPMRRRAAAPESIALGSAAAGSRDRPAVAVLQPAGSTSLPLPESVLRALAWPERVSERVTAAAARLPLPEGQLRELRGNAQARRALWALLRAARRRLRDGDPP